MRARGRTAFVTFLGDFAFPACGAGEESGFNWDGNAAARSSVQ